MRPSLRLCRPALLQGGPLPYCCLTYCLFTNSLQAASFLLPLSHHVKELYLSYESGFRVTSYRGHEPLLALS